MLKPHLIMPEKLLQVGHLSLNFEFGRLLLNDGHHLKLILVQKLLHGVCVLLDFFFELPLDVGG